MKEKEKEKSFEKLDKKILNKLNNATTAKSWSDLLPIMKDIFSLLNRNIEYDFHDLSVKKILAKRLAQALNPECPSGLHEVTLDVYELILTNIISKHQNKLMDNLYLYAYGLFPFFPNATIQNKIKFMDKIVTPIFLQLNINELKLCLPGLLSSLIPGLDDNNEQIGKIIYRTFDQFISNNNGELERDFFGVYWMLLLRCQHLRNSGIKYLLEKITKYEDFIKLDENKKKEIIDKQFPNINKTVVNALCEIIKDKDIPTVRNGMDFIMTRLPLTKENNMINDKAKINLIISGLHLLINNEYSTNRRLKSWILGINNPDDEVVLNTNDMNYKMNLVIEAFKIIFNSDNNLEEVVLLNNIKIIQRLFESQEEFINLILPDLSYVILNSVVNFWEINLDMAENVEDNKIIESTKKFFEQNEMYFDCLWKSLAKSIKDLSLEKDTNLFKRFCEVLIPLRFSLIFFDMKSNNQRIKYYFPLISNLLNIIKKIPYKREDFKKIKQIILITLGFVKSLQEERFHKKQNDDSKRNSEHNIHYELYDKIEDENDKNLWSLSYRRQSVLSLMSNEEDLNYEEENNTDVYNIDDISSLSNILKNTYNFKLIEDLSYNISKFQEYYINILNEYSKIDNQITKFEILLFRQCAELIIRLQEYSQEKDNQIPKWIKYLEKIIFNRDYPNILLSIEAANILFDLNLSKSLRNNTFITIKKNFKTEEIYSDIIDSTYIKKILEKIDVQPNCFELSLAKFYLLSNKQTNQTMIMELLLKMYSIDKKKFVEIINKTFNSDENFTENIILFNNFWKLANEYYPEENFFEKGECILNMVDLLDNKNPLLRHLSKTWLNQANQYYNKIINPILLIFFDTRIIFELKKEENTTEYIREFDTSRILDGFAKLKNIILNCQIMDFLKNNKPKNELIYRIRFETFNKNNMFYLQTLISVALHYTKAKAKDTLDEKFKKEIFSVNATSCEFLEFLLNKIDDKQFLIDNNKIINDIILNLLNKSLKENDEVMPAQLLDVLKALYFRCPLELIKKPQNKTIFLKLLNNKKLIEILIKGMTNDHFYIREHFLLFAKKCIENFISIITIEDKKELQDFYDLCNEFIQPLSQLLLKRLIINNDEKQDTEKYSHYDKKCNQLIFKNYCEEYKEYKSYDESDVLSILKSIKDIIKNCFKNEILEKSNTVASKKNVKFLLIEIPFIKKKSLKIKLDCSGDWVAFKKELVNSLKLNNPFISFLTTVIIDYTDKNPNKEISKMPTHLFETQISTLLNSLLSIWINQSDRYQLYDYCLNNNGILAPINDSKKTLSEEQINLVKENIKNNPIKQYILDIAMNLFITDSVKFIGNIIGMWCMDLNIREQSGINDKQYKLSIIELLISMDIPLDIILFCIGYELQNKFRKDVYKKVNKNYETPYEISYYEAKIFHFIYSYLLLNPNRYSKEKNENEIIEIWKELINMFNNLINGTKILYSYCWMYEIMNLASTKFNIQNIDNKDIKTNIENIFNILTNKLMDAVFSEKLDSKYINQSQLVLPFLPHIYTNIVNILYEEDNLYKKNVEGSSNAKNNADKNENNDRIDNKKDLASLLDNDNEMFDKKLSAKRSKTIATNNLFRFNNTLVNKIDEKTNDINIINMFYNIYIEHAKTSSEYYKNKPRLVKADSLNIIYQNLAFITLKENFYPLIKNLFDDNLSKVKNYYTDIINKLLSLIKNDKKNEKQFQIEYANEFVVNLMEKAAKNIVSCSKSQLMDYIKSPQLFNCSVAELHGRRMLISKMRENYQDILVDLIHDMNVNSIFGKKSDEEKKKILRRVSFVIYSCEKDVFSKDFGVIRSKAIELLSDYSDNNLLENEIFLIMRMLFLRFSHDGVMQMIRDLWPIIFTELIENILNEKRNQDFNLLLESFKFVELLSLVNIEEFSLYQWIFMLDTFDMNNLNINKEDSLLKKLILNQENLFKPLSLEYYGKKDISIDEKLLETNNKGKSELYINAKNKRTLISQIKKFFFSIGDMNSYKVDVNYSQIENNIENDFLAKDNS